MNALTVNNNNPPSAIISQGDTSMSKLSCLLHRCCQLSVPAHFPFTSVISCVLPWHRKPNKIQYLLCLTALGLFPTGSSPVYSSLFSSLSSLIAVLQRPVKIASPPYFCPLWQNVSGCIDLLNTPTLHPERICLGVVKAEQQSATRLGLCPYLRLLHSSFPFQTFGNSCRSDLHFLSFLTNF